MFTITIERWLWTFMIFPSHVTDCVNLGTHLVTSSLKPASFNSKTASYNKGYIAGIKTTSAECRWTQLNFGSFLLSIFHLVTVVLLGQYQEEHISPTTCSQPLCFKEMCCSNQQQRSRSFIQSKVMKKHTQVPVLQTCRLLKCWHVDYFTFPHSYASWYGQLEGI